MTKLEEAVIEAAKQLPKRLRRKLADDLLNGETPLSPEWMTEIDRRLADIDSGKSKSYPFDAVMRKLDAELAKRSKS